MNTLYFEKLSQFDRVAEPVTVSVPLAQGALRDPQCLVVRDGEHLLAVQRRTLAHWEDGSVKWLLLHMQPDLPGNGDKTLHFEIESEPMEIRSPQSVAVEETAAGVAVDTGVLAFLIPAAGFWPVQEVELEGERLWGESPFGGWELVVGGEPLDTAGGAVQLEVEEAGPLRAVVLIRGAQRRCDGTGYVAFRGRVTAYAGKSYIEGEHQFIHGEEEEELTLEGLELRFVPGGAGEVALGEGYYQTAVQKGAGVSMLLDAETMLYQANEHFIDSFYGDFWVDWRNERGGLTCSIHQAHQNFPKRLAADAEGITCALYPSEAGPVPLLQGMGKTHRILLHFHAGDLSLAECGRRSLQFQLPDRPALDRAWYEANNPWVETWFPAGLPGRLLTYLNELHDGRPQALGMFHFGDAPDSGYTDQGRGGGESVWVNNEYDRPHCCALFYGLTGQRRALDSALVCARHWLDVDLCHYSPDPLLHGGLKIHTRYHVTGRVTPSHEWTEGFLDYYFLTGRLEGLEAAVSVAENVLRHMARPEMSEPGATSVREGGWALRAMVGMWLGTGEERWRDEARRIVDTFLQWADGYGALLAPYTSHSMPRVPFMISLTVASLGRYLLVADEARVKNLIVEVMDDLIAHCLGPDGIFYYKELPSLQRTAPTPHALEALTYAFRISGDRRYLEIAARQFAALLDRSEGLRGGGKRIDASGAVVQGMGGGRIFADKYTSILVFASEAAPRGLLDWCEYPFAAVK